MHAQIDMTETSYVLAINTNNLNQQRKETHVRNGVKSSRKVDKYKDDTISTFNGMNDATMNS